MVIVLVGIAIGVLITIMLIIKAVKTPPHDVVGVDMHCRKCGLKINGLTCQKCEKTTKSFGV